VSADSHPINGSTLFSVGTPEEIDAATIQRITDSGSDQTWEIVAGIARFLTYLGTLLVAGIVVFLAFVDHRAHDRMSRFVSAGAVAGIVGAVLGVVAQTALEAGQGIEALTDWGTLSDTMTGTVGLSAALAVAGMVALWALSRRVPDRIWTPVAVAVGLASVGSLTLVGHNRTSEPVWLVSTADVVHAASAAIWFGGLVALVVTLRRQRADHEDPSESARVVGRFSVLATGAIVVVSLVGFALSWVEVGSLSKLTGTTYGWTLLAKVGVVVLVAVAGAYNHFVLVPAIGTAEEKGREEAWRQLRQTVLGESLGLVLVLAITAGLVNLTPAKSEAEVPEFSTVTTEMGDGEVEVFVDPAEAGSNELHISYWNADGELESGAAPLALEFSLPSAGVEPIRRDVDALAAGHWIYSGREFSIPGEWKLGLSLRIDDFTEVHTTIDVPIG
jgi:copper transport protein